MTIHLVAAPRGTADFAWAQRIVREHHYLRAAVDPRCRPFAYAVTFGSRRVGCLIFGRPESTCCFQGGLTYGSLRHVAAGRAQFDRWEVLNLARVWLDPRVQAGGTSCMAGILPGFTDRRGVFRSILPSMVIGQALGRVGFDYLAAFPPCFVEEPYAIRVVMSYCDRRLHKGTIYRASGFALARCNAVGVETWYTPAVAPLTDEQDGTVRQIAERSVRSQQKRMQRASALHNL